MRSAVYPMRLVQEQSRVGVTQPQTFSPQTKGQTALRTGPFQGFPSRQVHGFPFPAGTGTQLR